FGLCVCGVDLVCSAAAAWGNVPVARLVALCALGAGEYAAQPVSLRRRSALYDCTERCTGICTLTGVRARFCVGALEGAVAVACNDRHSARCPRSGDRCISARCFAPLGG